MIEIAFFTLAPSLAQKGLSPLGRLADPGRIAWEPWRSLRSWGLAQPANLLAGSEGAKLSRPPKLLPPASVASPVGGNPPQVRGDTTKGMVTGITGSIGL